MQLNMTTFAGRKQHYIDETFRTLLQSDWRDSGIRLNLILGSDDDSHVRNYADHPLVHIVRWDLEADPNLRWNCTLNKIRALRWGEDEATLICEDDVAFALDWLSALRDAVDELGDERYVLSLFAAPDQLEREPLLEGKCWIKRYPGAVLQGAQALYYPSRAIRLEAAAYLSRNLRRACGDELLGRYALSTNALYATREVIVDHVGQVSCFH
jgi:hypothetical protein